MNSLKSRRKLQAAFLFFNTEAQRHGGTEEVGYICAFIALQVFNTEAQRHGGTEEVRYICAFIALQVFNTEAQRHGGTEEVGYICAIIALQVFQHGGTETRRHRGSKIHLCIYLRCRFSTRRRRNTEAQRK